MHQRSELPEVTNLLDEGSHGIGIGDVAGDADSSVDGRCLEIELDFRCALGGIRTPNLLIRRPKMACLHHFPAVANFVR